MIIVRAGAKRLDDPVDVDVSEIVKTSLLITGFSPLPSLSLIAAEESRQAQEKAEGQLIDTNLVIYGSGTAVTLNDETDRRFAAAPASPIVAPTPSKFGALETITAPNPFPITTGTQIKTDPSITTNGITAYGKIYRGPAEDGPLATYLFGSTSAFDNSIKFGLNIDPNILPVAGFKFQSLSLLGNPTIDLSNGGTTKLALIAIDGITSGPPGGP